MRKSGFTMCDDCGMGYNRESQDDVVEHDRYHDVVVNGLPTRALPSDCVVWSRQNERLAVVSQISPREQRALAEEVARYARKDAGYGAEVVFDKDMEVRVFLLHKVDRAIGLLLVDKRARVCQASWDELYAGNQPKVMPNHPLIWTVCFVWILKQHRRLGFASAMLDRAIVYLGCRLNNIGWYTSSSAPPFTPSGEAFVRTCCPEKFLIAK